MTVKPLVERTAPVGIAVLGVLVIATGWLLMEGAPFVLGCLAMLALAGGEIALLVGSSRRS